MSRTTAWVAAAYTTILTMVMSVLAIIFALPATAAEPISPTQLDRCGADPMLDQDQYVIPVGNGGDVYYVGGVYQEPGTYAVSGSSVTINSYGMTNGQWTFDYTNNAPCTAEATNIMAVDIRPCNPTTGLSEVLLTYTNIADATGWYDSDLYVEAYNKERDRVSISYVMDGMLLDGQSVTYDLADSDPSFDDGIEGLAPGTYVFTARHSRGGLTTYQARIESCSGNFPFPGTSSIPPVGSVTGKATAKIKPGRFVVHTTCVNARKVTGNRKVRFRVERKVVGSKVKTIKRSSLPAGSKACYKVKAKRGSLLFVKVFDPDASKWVRVARKRIKR